MSAAAAVGALLLPSQLSQASVTFQERHPTSLPSPAEVMRAEAIEDVAAVLRPKLRPVAPAEVVQIAEAIVDESQRAGFDPFFVLALMEYESGFNVLATSCTKSRGLMQLQQRTWERIGGEGDIFDPVKNVRAGIRVLAQIKASGFRRPETILLAYNQGPKIAGQWAKGSIEMPDEARPWIPKIMAKYAKHLKDQGHNPHHARELFAWDFPSRTQPHHHSPTPAYNPMLASS